jgi:hypothetical protein
MTMMDADDLDECTIVWTSAAFVIANTEQRLPREGETVDAGVLLQPSAVLISLLLLFLLKL